MFPVYSSAVPHGNNHHHAHAHATNTTHSHGHTAVTGHHSSDPLAPPHSTSTLVNATAASSLPLYSAYQLQQKAGYLHKEGDVWKTWKRRYFVLSSQLLSYYTDRDATTPKGHILLQGAEVRVSQRTDRSGWVFEVYRDEAASEHRVYYLQADSESERSEWMAAIKNNILFELNRTRALVDEVDKYRARIAQLMDELERQKAQQILADWNKPRTEPPSTTTAPAAVAAVSASDAQQQPQERSPSSVELVDRVRYLEAENARLVVENQSLKRSTLAMQGKGDEIRQTADTRRDEAAAARQQPTSATAVAAVTQESQAGGVESEVERLSKELARVRVERGILKREVLRLMAVNEQLTQPPHSAATGTLSPQTQPQISTATV